MGRRTQKKLSQVESKEVVEEEVLQEIAKALKVPVEAIREYNEEIIFYNIQNNYEGSKTTGSVQNYNCTFNPLDELMEAHKQIAKLNAALLKEKDEKIALLKSIKGKKK